MKVKDEYHGGKLYSGVDFIKAQLPALSWSFLEIWISMNNLTLPDKEQALMIDSWKMVMTYPRSRLVNLSHFVCSQFVFSHFIRSQNQIKRNSGQKDSVERICSMPHFLLFPVFYNAVQCKIIGMLTIVINSNKCKKRHQTDEQRKACWPQKGQNTLLK